MAAKLKYEKAEGCLVDAEEVGRFLNRTFLAAVAILEDLPDQVVSLLPVSIKAKQRNRIRGEVTLVKNNMRNAFAELAKGEDEDNEPAEE